MRDRLIYIVSAIAALLLGGYIYDFVAKFF
jgi:hypothetical protein